MIYLLIFVLLCVIFFFVFLDRQEKKRRAEVDGLQEKLDEQNATRKISEEKVIQREQRFDKHLEHHAPFSPSGKERYVYLKLMRPWYQELSSKNRYNEEIAGKLRQDWYDYMNAIDEQNRSSFVAAESWGKDKEDSEEYSKDAEQNGRKAWAIEDAFAAAVGQTALDELARIRAKNREPGQQFDSEGNMAPDGFTYNSAHEKFVPENSVYDPYSGEFVPKK